MYNFPKIFSKKDRIIQDRYKDIQKSNQLLLYKINAIKHSKAKPFFNKNMIYKFLLNSRLIRNSNYNTNLKPYRNKNHLINLNKTDLITDNDVKYSLSPSDYSNRIFKKSQNQFPSYFSKEDSIPFESNSIFHNRLSKNYQNKTSYNWKEKFEKYSINCNHFHSPSNHIKRLTNSREAKPMNLLLNSSKKILIVKEKEIKGVKYIFELSIQKEFIIIRQMKLVSKDVANNQIFVVQIPTEKSEFK